MNARQKVERSHTDLCHRNSSSGPSSRFPQRDSRAASSTSCSGTWACSPSQHVYPHPSQPLTSRHAYARGARRQGLSSGDKHLFFIHHHHHNILGAFFLGGTRPRVGRAPGMRVGREVWRGRGVPFRCGVTLCALVFACVCSCLALRAGKDLARGMTWPKQGMLMSRQRSGASCRCGGMAPRPWRHCNVVMCPCASDTDSKQRAHAHMRTRECRPAARHGRHGRARRKPRYRGTEVRRGSEEMGERRGGEERRARGRGRGRGARGEAEGRRGGERGTQTWRSIQRYTTQPRSDTLHKHDTTTTKRDATHACTHARGARWLVRLRASEHSLALLH